MQTPRYKITIGRASGVFERNLEGPTPFLFSQILSLNSNVNSIAWPSFDDFFTKIDRFKVWKGELRVFNGKKLEYLVERVS